MSKRLFSEFSFQPTAQADGVLTGSWAALKAGSATDILKIGKIVLGGQASSSAVNAMVLARSSALGITPTALTVATASDGPVNVAASAPSVAPVASIAAATAPNRSPAVTIPRLMLTFNAFGGIITWQTNPGSEEEWTSVGTATASNSESVLSAWNVGTPGLMSSDIFYEVL
jgi:hypothetical protein